jgi:hypothetical protein
LKLAPLRKIPWSPTPTPLLPAIPTPTNPTFRVNIRPISKSPTPPAPPPTTTASRRGKSLTDAEKRQLVQSCIDNAEIFGLRTKRWFWINVATDFKRFSGRDYSHTSCQRNIESLVGRRRANLRIIETGKSQDSNPRLNEVLDQWIAIVDTYELRVKTVKNAAKRRLVNIQTAQNHRQRLSTTLGPRIQATASSQETTLEHSPVPSTTSLQYSSNETSTSGDDFTKRGKQTLETEVNLAFLHFLRQSGRQQSQQATQDPALLHRLQALEDKQKGLIAQLETLRQIDGKLDTLLARLNH